MEVETESVDLTLMVTHQVKTLYIDGQSSCLAFKTFATFPLSIKNKIQKQPLEVL